MDKTEAMTFKIEKNHGLFDKAVKDYSLGIFYKYITMIFSVFDYTCAMIPNYQILYLKQVKDDPPQNPPTVFRVRVRALFEWQNRSKVAFSFVFAFALCINGL